MKLTKLWASALALLTLASCSQDVDVVQPQEAPATRQVHINLTAGQDDNALRVAFGLDSDGKTTGLKMSDKNVILRVAVRRASGETTVQDLTFVKAPGRNHATYSGQITIPAGGTGSYTIAAVLLKEDGLDAKQYGTEMTDEEFASSTIAVREGIVSFKSTGIISHDPDVIEANIPYVTKWQPLTINASQVAEPVTLELRPFGTLLRMRIKNESTVEETFSRITFRTNAFNDNVAFEFLRVRGAYPHWASRNAELFNLPLSVPVTVQPSTTSPWMYTVLYPRETASEVVTVGGLITTTTYYKAFRSTQPLPHGSVPMTFVYTGNSNAANFDDIVEKDEWSAYTTPRPKMAIEYVAQYAFSKTKTSLVSDHLTDNAEIGYFTYDEAVQLATPVTIDGVKYSTPTRGEMLSIFPYRFDGETGNFLHGNNVNYKNYLERGIKIGDTTRDYLSDYSKRVNAPLYAIRFKNTVNKTAYRYRTTTIDGTASVALVVDCIYLGAEEREITEVATPTFWTSRQTEIVSRTFPLYGTKYTNSTLPPVVNGGGDLMTADKIDDVTVYAVALFSTNIGYLQLKSITAQAPIVPWIRD